MKGIKLWAGIIGVVVAAYILAVSGYEAAWNLLTTSGHINGAVGIVVAALLLAGSIVRIATRESNDDAGSIVSLILFGVATALAFGISPIYHYMRGWALLCLVMAIISVIMIMIRDSRKS